LRPTSGDIILNKKINNQPDLLKITSVVPQDINLINGTLEENIHMDIFKNKKNINNEKFDYHKIKYSQIEDIIEDLPNGIYQEIQDRGKNLSGGQKQRIGFARALFKNSKVLIFDEPTNNLDVAGKQKFIKNILELSKHKKIILITHDNEFKEINSKIYEIKNFDLKEIKHD
jgi:ABC-type bacteriocin/lantibiotic exporter with double-glycine peptidase domain